MSDEVEYSHKLAHVNLGTASRETLEAARLLSSASPENTPGLMARSRELLNALGRQIERLGKKMDWRD